AAMTAKDLRKLDAGAWFSSRFRGERIPTLEESLKFARGRGGLNIEIKQPPARRAAGRASVSAAPDVVSRAVAAALTRTGFKDLLVVSSFSPGALQQARAVMARVALGLLVSRSLRGLRSAHRRVGLFSVHPHARVAAPRRIRLAHRLRLAVVFWTINDLRLMRRLLALGADGLMTN